jgi:hypothetical protein
LNKGTGLQSFVGSIVETNFGTSEQLNVYRGEVTEITEGGIIVLYEDGGAQMYTESDFEESCGVIEQVVHDSKTQQLRPQQLNQHKKYSGTPTPSSSSSGSSSSSVGKPVHFGTSCWAWLAKQGWQCVHGDTLSNYHYIVPAAAVTPKHDRVHGFDFFRTLDEVWAHVAPRTSSMVIGKDQRGSGEDENEDDGPCSEEWRTSGHRWIGARLARCFASGIVTGRVTRWLPAGEKDKDAASWGMEHDDGDVEELEEWEVVEAINTLREKEQQLLQQGGEDGEGEEGEEGEEGTSGNKRKQPTPTTTAPAPAYGQLVDVMWQQDSTYYPGKCVGYDAASGKHTIEYEDGSTEVLRLRREGGRTNSASAIWRLCGKRRRSNNGRGREVKSKDESRNNLDTRGGHKHTSKYRGVFWDKSKSKSKWQAEICHTGKKLRLGCFDDEEEAARAYDRAARAYHGEKAMPNFPAEGDGEQEQQHQHQQTTSAAPIEMHSWSGMYPSVVVALGFRLQVRRSEVAGAKAEEKSAGGTRSRGGEGRKLNRDVVIEEAKAREDTTWAYESILRKRHASGSKVEYEVGGYCRAGIVFM